MITNYNIFFNEELGGGTTYNYILNRKFNTVFNMVYFYAENYRYDVSIINLDYLDMPNVYIIGFNARINTDSINEDFDIGDLKNPFKVLNTIGKIVNDFYEEMSVDNNNIIFTMEGFKVKGNDDYRRTNIYKYFFRGNQYKINISDNIIVAYKGDSIDSKICDDIIIYVKSLV